MSLFGRVEDRFRRGSECGDYADGDGWLDATFAVDESLEGIHGLVGTLSRPDGLIVGGRIQWDKVLAGFFPAGLLEFERGWEKRGAPVMDPNPAACTNHHTGGRPTSRRPCPSLIICRDGRPAGKGVTAVPGPLVHAIGGYDGVLHVLASGRANHAGMGHVPLLERMRAGLPPAGTAKALGLRDTGGFGGHLIGIEWENSGYDPLTDAQVLAAARWGHALWRLGLGRNRAIAWDHEAQTQRKWDLVERDHARIRAAYDAWKPLT